MLVTKKKLFIITPLLICLLAAIGICIALVYRESTPQPTAYSTHKTISLNEGTLLQKIIPGMPIAGSYRAKEDQALFYTVTNNAQHILGSGAIMPDANGHYSRNLDFKADDVKEGTPLHVNVYTQSNRSKKIDQLSVSGTFTASR